MASVRRIGAVTVARSDFGILQPVLEALRAADDMDPLLYVAGAHWSDDFGRTVDEVRRIDCAVGAEVRAFPEEDTLAGAARAAARLVEGFARAWEEDPPDLLLVTGDRYEMLAAAMTASILRIPIAHLHGGECSFGAADESFRHAITKLSHLHFAATEEAAARIRRLGEEAWRVTVTGAPSLDRTKTLRPVPDEALAHLVGGPLEPPVLVASYHPVTVAPERGEGELDALLGALEDHPGTVVFTYAGADPGGKAINERIARWGAAGPRRRVLPHLGADAFFSLLRRAAAMAGNSSAGIIEAASFELPVVNVGIRQAGRTHGPNVLDVPAPTAEAIRSALRQALDSAFRATLRGMRNPYGEGNAAPRIRDALRRHRTRSTLLHKTFADAAGFVKAGEVVKKA